MELPGAPSGLATFRSRYSLCFRREEPHARFIVRSRCLSASSPPLSFSSRVQIQFHPWSKQLFRIIPKAQSGIAPDEFADDSNDVSSADQLTSLRRKVKREARSKKAVERLDEQLLEDVKPPYVECLMGLGLDLDDIKRIVKRYHCIEYRSVDGEIRPFVEVLRNVGVDHKGLLVILRRWPKVLAVNMEKTFLPTMAYLESLGMDKEQCVKAICRFPQLITLNRETIEEKVAYFLELGVTVENVRKMISHAPQLLAISVEKNIKPSMAYLESLGMDKERCIKVLRHYPQLITLKREKIEERISYFVELGVTVENVRKMIQRAPGLLGMSVEKKFKPTMAYLEGLGMDKEQCVKAIYRFPQLIILNMEKIEEKVAYFLELGVTFENVRKMIPQAPGIFGMSVEKKLQPTTEFFLTKGFTKEELQTIVVRFPNIYNCSITKSLIPKWEFFSEIGYPTSDLANFPQYFGYSLEGRIKPRHKLAMEHGVRFQFTRLLSSTDRKFEMLLETLVSQRTLKDDDKCST